MDSQSQFVYEDQIDMREVIRALWRKRRIILVITLATALVALVISIFLPKTYQATAYVAIRTPIMEFTTNQGLVTTPVLPDLAALMDLVKTPGLLATVVADPDIIAANNVQPLSVTELNDMVDSSVLGKDQLRLQVTDTDPKRASLLANAWATIAADKINSTYGVAAVAQSLKEQVTQARQIYDQDQTILEQELSKNQVDVFNAQLQNEKNDLNCVLEENSATNHVLTDLQVLQQRLEPLPGDTQLSLGDALALTTLQQRALSSEVCTGNTQNLQVQISSDTLSSLTVNSGLEIIGHVQTVLKTQQTALTSQENMLEGHIPQLSSKLETAQNQVTQLTAVRDQARSLYETLSNQQQQLAAIQTKANQIATLNVQAVPPEKESSPKVGMNTALAGISGLMLSVFGVLVVEWWQNTDIEKQKNGTSRHQ